MATAMTLGRWLTWEPYAPVFLPYDLTLTVVGFWLVGRGVCGKRRSPSSSVFSSLAVATVFWGFLGGLTFCGRWGLALLAWPRIDAPAASSAVQIAFVVAGVTVGGLLLWHAHRRRFGPRWETMGLFAVFAFAVGLDLSTVNPWWILLLPLAGILSCARGLPRLQLSGPWVPIVCLTLLVISSITVAPGSRSRLPQPRVLAPNHGSNGTAPPTAGQSVLLVVADTLRRDHMSLYGYARKTTPHLDAWSQDARVYEAMTSATSWTLPSHASLFTGLFPRTHGAHGFPPTRAWGNAHALDDSHTTLAELARDHGYRTGAIVANHFYLNPTFGLAQGFETYFSPRPRKGLSFPLSDHGVRRFQDFALNEIQWSYYRAEQITDLTQQWLERHGQQPFFLFVNYMDVHSPNYRPADEVIPWEDETNFRDHRYDAVAFTEGRGQDPRIRRDLVNNYDRELRHLDREIGRLLRFLETTGLSERTTVIFTSDHGESLGERNIYFHSGHLYQEVTQVPLILSGPTIQPGRVTQPVQTVDLFPTILETLGVEYEGQTQGTSLGQTASAPIVAEWYRSENPLFLDEAFAGRFDRSLRTIQSQEWRLFVGDRKEDFELYDLSRDPRESTNLYSSRTDRARTLHQQLQKWLEKHPPADPANAADLDELDATMARELGYTGDE